MSAASPITRQTVGMTFIAALAMLGLGVLAQIGAVGWAFIARYHAPPEGGEMPMFARLTAPVGMRPDFSTDPFSTTLEEPPSGADPAAAGLPRKPAPVPVPAGGSRPEAVPQSRFEELILQGRQLRDRSDTGNALTRFREAAAMEPRNPIAIAELAATYESMRLPERAAEHWRRLYEMGGTAGIYFSLAEAKLKESRTRALLEATPAGATAAAATGVSGAPGVLLGLGKIRTEEHPGTAAQKKFTLVIPVTARPQAKIQVHDLVIHVLFYDKVDGKNVVQTSANVNSRWMTPPTDWADTDTEELAVEYELPPPEPGRTKRETREFYGYIVRVYYKQQLQAATAEPERLAVEYPAALTLPKANNP